MLSAFYREWVVFGFHSSRLMFFLVLFLCIFCVLIFVYLLCTNKDNNNLTFNTIWLRYSENNCVHFCLVLASNFKIIISFLKSGEPLSRICAFMITLLLLISKIKQYKMTLEKYMTFINNQGCYIFCLVAAQGIAADFPFASAIFRKMETNITKLWSSNASTSSTQAAV